MQTAATPTEAGLLLSLVSALPDPSCALARRARRIAGRLEHGACPRAVRREAADLLADLLTATDGADLSVFDLGDDVLCGEFDE